MARDITPEQLRCAYSMACPSVHQLQENDMCSIGGCPSVTPHAGDLVIVGKIAMGIAQQVHRADGRLISDTIAADETAVLVPAAVVSEIPEVVRLKARIEELEKALKPFAEAADGYDLDGFNFDAIQDYQAAEEITIGDIRRARAALSQGKETT